MKKLAKRIAALAMTAAMMTASAGAITQDGQSETWFDGVWALIDAFGLKAEHDPVSYTHLDVYKRQGYLRQRQPVRCRV